VSHLLKLIVQMTLAVTFQSVRYRPIEKELGCFIHVYSFLSWSIKFGSFVFVNAPVNIPFELLAGLFYFVRRKDRRFIHSVILSKINNQVKGFELADKLEAFANFYNLEVYKQLLPHNL
jgi:hypothetical protein